jgi:hypothetical protein
MQPAVVVHPWICAHTSISSRQAARTAISEGSPATLSHPRDPPEMGMGFAATRNVIASPGCDGSVASPFAVKGRPMVQCAIGFDRGALR